MAPVIHLVRHAQGYHNLSLENQWIHDPDLTEFGKQQCEDLCKAFPYHDKITHLVASPIRRTIFTCQFSFAPAVKAGKKIVALQDAQEVSLYACDIGSDVEVLKKEFGDLVDFSSVTDDWNQKTKDSKYYPDPRKLEARARDARLWLRDLVKKAGDDAHVALVTHGGILHFLTEDWSGIDPGRGTGWHNTEYRSYEFADETGADPNASLRELPESLRRRKGSETPYTDDEKREMRAAYEKILNHDIKDCVEKLAKAAANGETNGTNKA
ncbi:phosphoglycerate mutase-like protein [Xylaria bambusicola]|uniref:phosphoglycerate mutase-like protein n=1 Tax=Xylaria bambusicola TaxID=326684 RepID=UPI0020078F11|nr:phosphoglycerate mutase-like protein [Xylaria bambusicola]KAI0514995.1 phosphoglycerate mutase-like protein [Xylaria bambusicola]